MQPGPGQDPHQLDPYQQEPYQQYPPGYGEMLPPTSPYQPTEYSLYQPAEPAPQQPPPQPPPAYPAGGYAVPMMPMPAVAAGQSNTFGLLSMIFGIISIPLLCCFYVGIPLGIAAVVLGIIGTN